MQAETTRSTRYDTAGDRRKRHGASRCVVVPLHVVHQRQTAGVDAGKATVVLFRCQGVGHQVRRIRGHDKLEHDLGLEVRQVIFRRDGRRHVVQVRPRTHTRLEQQHGGFFPRRVVVRVRQYRIQGRVVGAFHAVGILMVTRAHHSCGGFLVVWRSWNR